jgi:hypothetical protein
MPQAADGRERTVTGDDLIVVAPWLVFGAGLAAIGYRLLRHRPTSGHPPGGTPTLPGQDPGTRDMPPGAGASRPELRHAARSRLGERPAAAALAAAMDSLTGVTLTGMRLSKWPTAPPGGIPAGCRWGRRRQGVQPSAGSGPGVIRWPDRPDAQDVRCCSGPERGCRAGGCHRRPGGRAADSAATEGGKGRGGARQAQPFQPSGFQPGLTPAGGGERSVRGPRPPGAPQAEGNGGCAGEHDHECGEAGAQ